MPFGSCWEKTLADRVLVRAGKRGVDQIADVGMARMDRQLIAFLDHLAHGIDVGEVQLRIDALGVEVQRHGDEVDVAGGLAVTEQAAFDPVGAGHKAQLGRRHAGTAVVVGVQADQYAVATRDVSTEVLDLIGIDVGRGRLDRGRQVENELVRRGRLEHLDHRVAHLDGELRLGGAEDLRRILEAPAVSGFCSARRLMIRPAFTAIWITPALSSTAISMPRRAASRATRG
ncbi:hypothetical protein SSTU70S_05177 [Stutzerimonas stutzeri]